MIGKQEVVVRQPRDDARASELERPVPVPIRITRPLRELDRGQTLVVERAHGVGRAVRARVAENQHLISGPRLTKGAECREHDRLAAVVGRDGDGEAVLSNPPNVV
jgi:hypothetical protein